jgi:hypothetical protein
MDELIQDTVRYLKKAYSSSESFLLTKDEYSYFNGLKDGVLEVSTVDKKSVLSLEPTFKPRQDSMEEMKRLIEKAAPQLQIKNAILDDSEAKKLANLWQEQLTSLTVGVLAYKETGKSLELLHNLAHAITLHLAPAKVIEMHRFEKEKKWDLFFSSSALKLVLVPDIQLWRTLELAKHYKQNANTSVISLGNARVATLLPIPSYLANPKEKRLLWNSIVSHLSS